ncbi:DUF6387 family protein [Oceanimonas smirnovii]|uniref:DUF6387 family protein n=1 Tax=Oceanimonas smirnovii TaxID=264574 RepID=A0ABW7P4L8_9GAMM
MLPVTINLEGNTDAEILADLATLLPQWRKALGVNEPERSKPNAGLSLLLKAVEYRVIPLLDLMLWQRMEGVSITRALLAAVLFPAELEDKPRDHNHMAQTIMPFVSSLFKNDTWKAIGLALEKDPAIKRRNMGEMLELERAHQNKKYRRGQKL